MTEELVSTKSLCGAYVDMTIFKKVEKNIDYILR